MTTTVAPTTGNTPRLSRPVRRAALVLHIVSAVGWVGVDLALVPVVLTGLTTDDGPTAAAAYRAVAIVVPWTVPALSVLILTTGLLLGLGTTWGLARYWWVIVKLVISVVLTVLVFAVLLPAVGTIDVTTGTSGDEVRATLDDPAVFLFPPVVSCLLLVFSVVLSVFKPWGRRSARRGAATPSRPRS